MRTLKLEAEADYEISGALAKEEKKAKEEAGDTEMQNPDAQADQGNVIVISDSEEERYSPKLKSQPASKLMQISDDESEEDESSGMRRAANGRLIRIYKREEDIRQTVSITQCHLCFRLNGRICMKCRLSDRTHLKRETGETSPQQDGEEQDEVMFRCIQCKRASHYGCLPDDSMRFPDEPEDDEDEKPSSDVEMVSASPSQKAGGASDAQRLQKRAEFYQLDWICDDCDRWEAKPDVILAWRPVGSEQLEGKELDDALQKTARPSHRDHSANAEYYVKWQDGSYRQAEWVPHAFRMSLSRDIIFLTTDSFRLEPVVATANARLRNFLEKGSELRDAAAEETNVNEDEGAGQGTLVDLSKFGQAPNPHAEQDIVSKSLKGQRAND